MEGKDMEKEISLEIEESAALRRQQRKMKIINEANSFAQRVSLVGLAHATNSKASKGRRIVWTFWLVFGFGLAIYQIQDRIAYYISYPYNTEFQIVSAKTLRFPQVTICKENSISLSKAKEFGVDQIFQRWFQMIEDLNFKVNVNLLELEDLSERLHNVTLDWGTLSKNLSHDWKDLVTYITWDGKPLPRKKEELQTDLGHCLAVSTVTKPLTATGPGMRDGLVIYLDSRQSDSMREHTSIHGIFNGFRLLIHDPEETPRMLEAGFVIDPGTVTRVAVTFENVTQLGPPYSDCETSPNYRVVNCLANCENAFFLKKCKCRPFYNIVPDHHDAAKKPLCSFTKHHTCLMKYSFRKSWADYQCNCAQQCHGRIYEYSLSQSQISSRLLRLVEDSMRSQRAEQRNDSSAPTEKDTEHDFAIVYIYFPNLMYKDVTSVASYSFLALLCDVGGALSLLLGATLLTVYEVAEFLALVVRDFLCNPVTD